MKKSIPSSIYSPKEVQFAYELAEALDDEKSLAFYLSCTRKYPLEFLRVQLAHVLSLPAHSVRTTRARLFTNIVTNSIYNTHDHIWD